MDDTAGQRFFEVSAGERTVPGIWHENYWFRRHEVVYAWLVGLLQGTPAGTRATVLDAGCGEGYGTAMLAEHADVVALDYDAWTAAHLADHYPGLPAVRANLVALPVKDGSVDLLVSLQTIEHLWDQESFVAESARVLRPGGRLVLSTPNRRTFPPGNVFHHRELDAAELSELLDAFDGIQVRGVHHGARLAVWEQRHGSIVDAQVATPVADWSPELAEMVRSVRTDDFELRPETHDSLDLLASAVAR